MHAATEGSSGLAPSGNSSGRTAAYTPVTGSCTLGKKVEFAANELSGLSTTSTSFVDVAGTSITAATKAGCVIVQFFASAVAGSGNGLYVRAVMDGTVVSVPGGPGGGLDGYQLTADKANVTEESHGVNLFFTGVSKGTHTFKVQYRSYPSGTVYIDWPQVTVWHS